MAASVQAGALTNFVKRLPCMFDIKLVQAAARFHDLLRMNFDVASLPLQYATLVRSYRRQIIQPFTLNRGGAS